MLSNVSELRVIDGARRAPDLQSLPERFRGRTLYPVKPDADDDAGFDPEVSKAAHAGLAAAQQFVLNWMNPNHRGGALVLIGIPGAGKTHLAAGICNAVWESEWAIYADRREDAEAQGATAAWPPEPIAPKWANVPSLINRLRGGDDDVRAEARSLGRYRGIVVLDDLGREKVTEWTGETVYVLVNERYEQRLPTIVTSNLPVKELADNGYGPAISRLAEDGRLVEMASAVDYRTRRG